MGLGLRVYGLGLRVYWVFGLRVMGLGLRVWGPRQTRSAKRGPPNEIRQTRSSPPNEICQTRSAKRDPPNEIFARPVLHLSSMPRLHAHKIIDHFRLRVGFVD